MLRDRDEECNQRALVLTSELVTNAIVHARTRVDVRVEVGEDHMRVEVVDGDPHLPAFTPYAPDALGGRGLFLVQELASAWGTAVLRDGKVVWFRLDNGQYSASQDASDRYAPPGVHG